MGAGILPVTIYKNKFYFLFGREYNERKWSDFGGKKENNESFFDTAVREGFEETDGFLGNKSDIENLIKKNLLNSITLNNKHRTYLVFIPYDNTLPKRFRKQFLEVKKKHPEKISKNGKYEKDMIKWVRFDKLDKFYSEFRPWFKNIIKLIKKYGVLSEKNAQLLI